MLDGATKYQKLRAKIENLKQVAKSAAQLNQPTYSNGIVSACLELEHYIGQLETDDSDNPEKELNTNG